MPELEVCVNHRHAARLLRLQKDIILRYPHESPACFAVIAGRAAGWGVYAWSVLATNQIMGDAFFTSCYDSNGTLVIDAWSDGKIAVMAIRCAKNVMTVP